jgi:integrase
MRKREDTELFLTKDEIGRMIECARQNELRDSLLMSLLRCTGIRRHEAATLSPNQLNAKNGTVHIIGSKAKKWEDRVIPVDSRVMDGLRLYIDAQGIKPKDSIFGISDRQIDRIIASYAIQAGLDHPVGCHDFRRYFITYALLYNPLFTVMKWAGHKNPQTTKIYFKMPEAQEIKGYEDFINKI